MIDPGAPDPAEQERLFELLDELEAEGAKVECVLSTHHHPDHVGAVLAVAQRYGVLTRGHALTLTRLKGLFPELVLGEPIADGDTIDLGTAPDGRAGWQLEAIFTPGHDRGHLAFRESRYGALMAGDMVSTVATIMIDPPEGHLATYMDSLERLSRVPMTTLYPAHGPAVPNGEPLDPAVHRAPWATSGWSRDRAGEGTKHSRRAAAAGVLGRPGIPLPLRLTLAARRPGDARGTGPSRARW